MKRIEVARELLRVAGDLVGRPRSAGSGDLSSDHRTLEQLVDMDMESLGVEGEATVTPQLVRAAKKFDKAVEATLEMWVADNHDALEEDYDASDLYAEDGSYNVLMTLNGHGVGIWDGRWDHFFKDDRSIKDLERFLERNLSRYADGTGSGSFNEALMDAAFESGEGD